MRVVSLLPSATEIVYALGEDDALVGVTFECDEPVRARTDKVIVVGGRDTGGMSPADIDAYVRAQVAAGVDLYTLHADALAGLDPHLIITQDLCRVCALPSGQVDDALTFLGCRAEVLSLDPRSLPEVLDSIITVGDRLGAAERAQALVAELRLRLETIAVALAGRPRPRAAVIEWVEPPYTAGHWIPDLLVAAGGEPVVARPGERSVETTWASFAAARPEVVLVAPCGFGLDAAAEQARIVADRLPGAAVWALDGNALVVRPGPRLVDGVEAMAAILHPDVAGPPAPGAARRVA